MLGSTGQLIVVLVVFAGVLTATWFATKWISGYQRTGRAGSNIQLMESAPLAAGKYVQILRLGDRYVAVAVSKDNVTMLGDIDEDALTFPEKTEGSASFKSILSGVNHEKNNRC